MRRKLLTIVDVVKRADPRIGELFNEMIEAQAKFDREFCEGLFDLMDRKQLFQEATVANPKPKQFIPTFDNVLVRRDEADSRTKGGIIMPDTAKEKPKRGFVVAVGPGRWTKEGVWVEPPCKAGDIVFVRHWNGADVKFNGADHEIFNAAEIIGVETDDKVKIEKAYGKPVA